MVFAHALSGMLKIWMNLFNSHFPICFLNFCLKKWTPKRLGFFCFTEWCIWQSSMLLNSFLFLVEQYFPHRKTCAWKAILLSLNSPSLTSCSHSCLRNSWCSSTNFKKPSKDNDQGTCELNQHGFLDEDAEFQDEQGVTYSVFLKVGYGKNF